VQDRQFSFHSLFHRRRQVQSFLSIVLGISPSYRKQRFFQVLPESYPAKKHGSISDGARTPQEPHWKQE
jgi:hypothetical protein